MEWKDYLSSWNENASYCAHPYVFSSVEWEQLKAEVMTSFPTVEIINTLEAQFAELYALQHPPGRRNDEFAGQQKTFVADRMNTALYVAVFYPWRNKVVFLLEKRDFFQVRTSRNLYKITPKQQHELASKTVGIVGLSVGQSLAVTLAMERSIGTLRIADFDVLDVSNLNRLRATVLDVGLPKTTITAREIAEIDPFIKVEVFPNGLTSDTMTAFMEDNGRLDVLVDECDGFPMKVAMRKEARKLGIPVLMDTSDRGMLDVERFDLEPDRPIFHGLIPEDVFDHGLPTREQMLPYLYRLVGGSSISPGLAVSFFELNQTIGTWPQLASAVMLGGGVGAGAVRRIMLGQPMVSGRWIHDVETEGNKPTEFAQVERLNPLGENMARWSPLRESPLAKLVRSAQLKIGRSYFRVEKEGTNFIDLAMHPSFQDASDQYIQFVFKLFVRVLQRECLQQNFSKFPSEVIQSDVHYFRLSLIQMDASIQMDQSFDGLETIPLNSDEHASFSSFLADTKYRHLLNEHDHVAFTDWASGKEGNALSVYSVFPNPIKDLVIREDVVEHMQSMPTPNTINGMMQSFFFGFSHFYIKMTNPLPVDALVNSLEAKLFSETPAFLCVEEYGTSGDNTIIPNFVAEKEEWLSTLLITLSKKAFPQK